jgi:dTDP-4-amino-4,6-dideoxygalactose transaminase
MRDSFLPYARPDIGEEEIAEVADSLRSGWVSTGPKVKRFEDDFAAYTGARHAVAVSSCTAALEISLAALGIGPGDEVLVPTLTFCATANAVVHLGATPVLVDVDETGLISLEAAAGAITSRTRAILPVHYAGQACDLDGLLDLAATRGIPVVEDAAHAAGSRYRGRPIGTFSQATAFSFYATKNMTTGEGGMITTNDDALAARMRRLALHGMSRDAWQRYHDSESWYYEVTEAGYKANMTDMQAALGIHQLRKLDRFNRRRRELAAAYTAGLAGIPGVSTPRELPGRLHTYHLYPIRIDAEEFGLTRAGCLSHLRAAGIGGSVHFIPLHRQPYYRSAQGPAPGRFPVADWLYEGLVSLPLYPKMSDRDAKDVIEAVWSAVTSRLPARASG